MATQPAAKVREFAQTSLEKIAYTSVQNIPTREPNDQYRLGYCVWNFLKDRTGSLHDTVRTSGARLLIAQNDAVRIIAEELARAGVSLEQKP
jgi:hypothetical protein